MTDKIREALAGVLAIVGESRGVDGYHLNGDIAEWDEFPEVEAARAALAQQPAHAVPAVHALLDSDSVPDDFRNQASGYRAGWNDCLAAAPAAPVAQEQVALEQRATEAHALLRRVYDSGFDDDCVDAVGDWLNEYHTSPAAEQLAQSAPDELRARCDGGTCGLGEVCENCMMADAIELAAEPDTVAVPRELLAEAESIIDSYAEALKASHAPGGDWDGEEAAHDEYELEAGVASKLRAILSDDAPACAQEAASASSALRAAEVAMQGAVSVMENELAGLQVIQPELAGLREALQCVRAELVGGAE